MNRIKLIISIVIVLFLSSCVSMKQYNEASAKLENQKAENERLNKELMDLSTKNTELGAESEQLRNRNNILSKENDELKYEKSKFNNQLSHFQKEKEELAAQLNAIQSGSSTEIRKLLEELDATRGSLNAREDKLLAAEKELSAKQSRLIELENILARKDQAVKELKSKVTQALVGFNNNGLTVFEKNGKVYVSLEEQLLFKTGQWIVDPNGKKAIEKLANVLAQNNDINVMVEGHTDNVPMNGTGTIKDNWDLSVMRATAVAKILTSNSGVNPKQIIAAGRSKYMPVDDQNTAEARQKNRRTDIILTPKLDELLKIIEAN